MKKILVLLFCFITVSSFAQYKSIQQISDRVMLLHSTIFGTKDSLTLEALFASRASYGHSHGNLQTREEAIKSISKNKSVYKDTSVKDIKVILLLFRKVEELKNKLRTFEHQFKTF